MQLFACRRAGDLQRYSTGATLPKKLAEFAHAIASFDDWRRRCFYIRLASNLTICMRGIGSYVQLSDAEKVDQMTWLNEIQHAVTGALLVAKPRPDEDFFEGVLRARTNGYPPLQGHVGWAVKESYEHALAAERPIV